MSNLKKLISVGLSSYIAFAVIFNSADAADKRWTFDGNIHNNSLAVSPDETIAVASYSERSDIVVYDLKLKTVRKVLHGYITPRNIVFDPSGKAFYISDSSLGIIKKIDTTSLEEISRFPAGAGVFGTAISSDGKTLFANNEAANTVTSINLDTNQANAVITGFSQPRQGVKLDPVGATLFVTNFLGDKLTIVNAQTNRIEGEITGFNKIRAISISRDGKTLFAANSGTNMIAVVDIASRKIEAMIPVGKDPYGAALTPDGKFLYSGNLADNSLSVVSLATQHVIATVTGLNQPRQAIVFSHNNQFAYVLNEDLSIAIVSLVSEKVVDTVLPN
jgi:YVTN family beta-propeller protein